MRRSSSFISLLLIVALVVGLVAFSIGNGTQFSLRFFGYTFYHVPVWLPTVVGVVVGFRLACFVLTPGRLHGAWENNRLLKRISRHDWIAEQGRPQREVRVYYQRTSDLRISTTVPDATPLRLKVGGTHLGYHAHYVVDGAKRVSFSKCW